MSWVLFPYLKERNLYYMLPTGVTEHVIQKRALQVSNFLDMLRSASVDDHKISSKGNENARGEWKVCSWSWAFYCVIFLF